MKKLYIPSRWSLIFFTIVFLVAMIVRLPASLLTLVLPSNIQLQNIEGSFWNGKASALGINGVLAQEQLTWRFLPRSLLNTQALWNVEGRMPDKNSQLTLGINSGGVLLSGVNVVVPLEPLAALHPRLKSLQLGATLHLTAKTIAMNTRWDAVVSIDRLFSPLAPQGELGNYRINLHAEDNGKGNWQFVTVAGSLRITGNGTFDALQNSSAGQVTLIPPPQMQGLTLALSGLPRVGEGYQFTLE